MKRKLGAAIALAVLLLGGAAFALRPPEVPPGVLARSVTRTPALLARAWQLPAAAAYRRALLFQRNGSTCGPATLASVLGSLGERATTEAAVLEGTGSCWVGVCFGGLTLDQVADLARLRTRRRVTVIRDLSPEQFRRELRRSNDPGVRYTINFTRKPIFGVGGGHHSPIGGYLEDLDLVFVLDVNPAYRPWLVERPRLFAAMDTLDGDRKRGLLRID
jgi:hypothetical protein